MSLDNYQSELAWKIVKYEQEFDPYEFKDCYDNEIDAYDDCKKALTTSFGIKGIIKTLSNDIEYLKSFKNDDNFIKTAIKKASDLLKEVKSYSTDLNKMEGGLEI